MKLLVKNTNSLEEVVGGVVPKEFFGAVDKGIQERMKNGVLAGYPVVGVKAVLFDGSYHDVDSDELSFKMAGSYAFRDGFMKADPILLEPIMKVEVETPEDYMGDIMGDLNRRRGMVQGMDDLPWWNKKQLKQKFLLLRCLVTRLKCVLCLKVVRLTQWNLLNMLKLHVTWLEGIIAKFQAGGKKGDDE